MKRLCYLIILLMACWCIQVNASTASGVIGTWYNMDHNNGLLNKVIISQQNNTLTLHAWGYCDDQICDWGKIKLNKPAKQGYVLLKLYDQQTLGIAFNNVFTKYSKHPNKLFEFVMKRARAPF